MFSLTSIEILIQYLFIRLRMALVGIILQILILIVQRSPPGPNTS